MTEIRLVLVDPKAPLCIKWRTQFADLPHVKIVHGYFEQVGDFDCVVSPANAFGLMDGGVDASITRFFGESLMRKVQQYILEEYLGEQPIGTSFIVETGHANHPFLAHTPTMRIPMPITRTDNVYSAMWAMLLAVRRHNLQNEDRRIEVIACPGLGTGVGQMPFAEAARQMALAYRHFLDPPHSISWQFATKRQEAVRLGGDLGLMGIKGTAHDI